MSSQPQTPFPPSRQLPFPRAGRKQTDRQKPYIAYTYIYIYTQHVGYTYPHAILGPGYENLLSVVQPAITVFVGRVGDGQSPKRVAGAGVHPPKVFSCTC